MTEFEEVEEAPALNDRSKALTTDTEDFTDKLGEMAEKLKKSMEEL